MRKIVAAIILVLAFSISVIAQSDSIALYKKISAMIPMQDGVKLFTVIPTPVNAHKKFPETIN